MYYLGIDLGGTNIAVGIVDEENKIIARASSKTKLNSAEDVADAMAETAYEALKNAGITIDDVPWIGVGSPGTINKETGIIEFANNLPFKNTPMEKMLSERMGGKKVLMENDANAAAYGEYMAGALKGADNAIAITLGTGVGGGIIIGGRIYDGMRGAGAELGHTLLVMDGEPCTCGRRGCWEAYSSATALIRQACQAAARHPDSLLARLADVNGKTVFDAADRGDETAQAVVDRYCDYLGAGLVNIVNALAPDVILVGGGISRQGERLLAPVRRYVERNCFGGKDGAVPVIAPAKLGNEAGIIGAAAL